MKKSRIILALCTVSLLNACAQLPAGKPAVLTFQSSNESLLEDAERILALPAEAQHRELAFLNENNAHRDNQITSAIIYTLSNSRYCDAAIVSSEPSNVSATANGSMREQKWEKERKMLSKQLKDSTEENHKLAQKARDEQMRADSLQQKLDELRNIEQTMGNREQGTRK